MKHPHALIKEDFPTKKNLLVATIASLFVASTAAQANPFKGGYAGVEVSSNKSKIDESGVELNGKRKTTFGVVIGGLNEYGQPSLMGGLEAKLKFGGSQISTSDSGVDLTIKEKYQLNLSYLFGYNIADIAYPYVKLGYGLARFNTEAAVNTSYYNISGSSSSFGHGVEYGTGVKFALGDHVKLGVEYARQTFHVEDVSVKNNQVNFNLAYTF